MESVGISTPLENDKSMDCSEMKNGSIRVGLLALVVALLVSPVCAEKPKSKGFVSLFDGKSLDGWHAYPENTKGDWSVRGGAITGIGSANRLSYLVWKEEKLADFELRFQYRMVTEGNSGVEIHAQKDKSGKRPYEGYHADFGDVSLGPNVLGAWDFHFAKRREHPCPRGTSLVIKKDQSAAASKIEDAVTLKDIKKRDWNKVRLVARGNHFQFYINGKMAAEFTDNASDGQLKSGAIGLQLHEKGMEVQFKDLWLKQKKK